MSRDIHAPIESEREDILGRHLLAERIYGRLCDDDCPPAIGVYGGWGTGKTSLLNLLQAQNAKSITEGKKNTHIEIFDAWQYETAGNLLIPVIARLKKLSGDETFLPKSWKASVRRVMTVTTLTLAGLMLSKSPIQMGDIRAIWEDIEKRDKDDSSSILLGWETLTNAIQETQIAFQEVVKVVLKEQRCDRLVLCIDNLDRCSPDRAVSLLESIKNFFSVPGCIWLFAMDSDVVASYIDHKYGTFVMDGNSYLDKIIPEQYHLSLSPTLDREKIMNLLNFSVKAEGDLPFRIDESKIPQIPKILVPRRLIKSAKKFSEYYQDPALGVSPDTILSLVLLYHTWPAFYQRLSSASEGHISSILGHFFYDNPETIMQVNAVPLAEKFHKDEELTYFIRTAFADYKGGERWGNLLQEMLLALRELRRIGLP